MELPRRAPDGIAVGRGRLLTGADAAPARQLADEIRQRGLAVPGTSTPARGPLVLVVEDDHEMSRFLCESMPPDHRVVPAFDGREGLDAAISLAPDLVLVDVMMPGMGGEELVREIRKVPALARTAILVVTARADDALRVRMLREGAQDYVVKPVPVEELRARVQNLTAAKRTLDAESRLAVLVSQAPDGIFVADAHGRLAEINEAGCRLVRGTAESLLGKHALEFLAPEDAPRFERELALLHERHELLAEWNARRADGTFVPVEVSARLLPDGGFQVFARDISERRRMEEQLRQSELDLRRAQAVARIGSWRLDVTRDQLVWSEENHRIFGVAPGTPMTYERFLAIVHPDDREHVDRAWRAALHGAPYDIEHRLVVDGEVKWVRERAELVLDEHGRALGGIGTTQDITDRKQIEQALHAAEQRALEAGARVRAFAQASMALGDAVAAMPEVGVTSVMSAIAVQARLLVGAEYVAIGMGSDPGQPFEPWIQVGVPPEVAARIGRMPRPVGTLGLVARNAERVRVPDVRSVPEFRGLPPGHPTITSFLGVPIRFRGVSMGNLYLANKRGAPAFTADDERIVEMLATRAGAALETARLYQSEALARTWMQTVVDQMPEGVLLLDASGRVKAQNRGLRALAGAPRDVLDPFGNPMLLDLRTPTGEPVPPDELPYVRAIVHGESFSGREYQVRRADGSPVSVLVGVAPVTGAGGTRTGAVMVVQDVTAMKELERLREEWTTIVAHDLRQPVNVISISASMLDQPEHLLSEARRAKAIASIRSAARTLDRMVGDLMDASRIEASRMTLERRETMLPALVHDVVERIPEVVRRCDVVLAPGCDRRVLADPGRIEQVLANLLLNAVKYGERDGRIRIEIAPRDGVMELAVINRGPGIPADELPRLFRRFERARDAQGRAPGIGLGLYVAKGLIEAHGGRIWADSTPGQTTSFHFTLPFAPRREVGAARA